MADDGDRTVQPMLPKELVEKIVRRIPFPHILRVRELSREWKSEFPKVANQVSHSWPAYFPASIYDLGSRESWGVKVYDPVFNRVKRIGDKNFKITGSPADNIFCGALLVSLYDRGVGQPIVRVTNLITCQSRIIVCPMNLSEQEQSVGRQRSYLILVPLATDFYELIMWVSLSGGQRQGTSEIMHIYLYNSRSRTWIETSFDYDSDWCPFVGACAYMDGSLYYIPKCNYNGPTDRNWQALPKTLVGYNVQTGARTETAGIELDDEMYGEWLYSGVARCGSRIMAIVFEYARVPISNSFSVKIFQLDPDACELVILTRTRLYLRENIRPLTEYIRIQASSNCVYILQADEEVLSTYDVISDRWSIITPRDAVTSRFWPGMGSYVFEPGLNPFLVP